MLRECLCDAGAALFWTRGVGLMSDMDIIAKGIERRIQTFSATEMAFEILRVRCPRCCKTSIRPKPSGQLGDYMDRLPDLADVATNVPSDLNSTAPLRRAITTEYSADSKGIIGADVECSY
jgi:3-oxoacyl-ACP reductase-like protein